ncbi:MAG: hypothetical protein CVT63_02695 [Candidatus Anoxymicrobium japonicum]|uniref:GGDEF domain-containing protein n=1 Tax=Candidatus Anoxymicrobium japonicum TaxID=2013648 RepID=A0A2N3G6X6_9ACTN|nr:MAG: hypothetical protein CVT63_02695 [Candidatus Anoxymicrobium japonicum]
MKERLSPEALAMIFQWVITVVLTPFVLLPLFLGQEIDFAVRLTVVIGACACGAVMTVVYFKKRASRMSAAAIVEQRKRSESDIRYRISHKLSSSLDMGSALENACKLAIHETESAGCAVFLVEDGKDTLAPVMSVDACGTARRDFPAGDDVVVARFEEMYDLAARPPALQARESGGADIFPAFLRARGTLLVAPVFTRGNLSGLLCCTDPARGRYDESHASLLAALAGETALAVMNARLHEHIKSDAAQMASLIQLANAIGSTADLKKVMRLALDTVRHLFDCDSGLIYRVDETEGYLRYMESFGYSEEILDKLSTPPYPLVQECWTVSEDRLIEIDDLSQTRVECRTLEKIGQGSTICVGIQAEGKTLGVLHVRSERPCAFDEKDQQLAMAVADQIGIAIQRALLFEEINRLAVTDPLTGVFNVRRLEAVLREEVSRAKRYGRSVSFIMMDVDNFKEFNDTLGHQQGDIALSRIASIIDGATRDVDKVFRYGGDEFCAVLPETNAVDAGIAAEKIRREVFDFCLSEEKKVLGSALTISAGVAAFPENAAEESELVRQADIALYAAKQMDRNTVVLAR